MRSLRGCTYQPQVTLGVLPFARKCLGLKSPFGHLGMETPDLRNAVRSFHLALRPNQGATGLPFGAELKRLGHDNPDGAHQQSGTAAHKIK